MEKKKEVSGAQAVQPSSAADVSCATKCDHKRIVAVWSPDDGGYYGECRSGCWAIGPIRARRWDAIIAFKKQHKHS